MAISREKFEIECSKTSNKIQEEILLFLGENIDNAYTKNEIEYELGYEFDDIQKVSICVEKSILFNRAFMELIKEKKIRKCKVENVDYFLTLNTNFSIG